MPHQTTPQDATQTVVTIDAMGLRCPLPLLKAKQALNQIAAGQCIRVWATDKGSVRDFQAFARLSGHTLVTFTTHSDHYEYVLQKSE